MISENVKEALAGSSMIRKMFEEGIELKKKYGEDKVFDFSLGNPDIDPPKEFHEVFVKFAAEDKKGSHGYMPNAGYGFVKDAIAKKVSREQGVNLDGACIIMTAGAAAGLNAVFKTLCNPDDQIIVPRPFFVEYRAYAKNHNIKLIEVDTKDDFNLDLNEIEKSINEKTKAVLINSPNNPTGKIYSASLLAELSSLLKEKSKKTGNVIYLISDEPYREISYNTEVPPFLCCYKDSIVVSSYSKNLSLAGERIGYIAVNPEISCKDDVLNGMIYCARVLGFVNAPALMQRIVAELTDVTVDTQIYAKRRDTFMKVLDDAEIEYSFPEGAFYMFCKVPNKGTDADFVEHLKKYRILGVPGTGFGKSGWVRFAYCVDEKIIAASASAFKEAVKTWCS